MKLSLHQFLSPFLLENDCQIKYNVRSLSSTLISRSEFTNSSPTALATTETSEEGYMAATSIENITGLWTLSVVPPSSTVWLEAVAHFFSGKALGVDAFVHGVSKDYKDLG